MSTLFLLYFCKGGEIMNKWWTAFFQALAAFAGSVLGSFTDFLG